VSNKEYLQASYCKSEEPKVLQSLKLILRGILVSNNLAKSSYQLAQSNAAFQVFHRVNINMRFLGQEFPDCLHNGPFLDLLGLRPGQSELSRFG